MWVKVSSAATSVVCSACVAAAIALPAADSAANGSGKMAKTNPPSFTLLAAEDDIAPLDTATTCPSESNPACEALYRLIEKQQAVASYVNDVVIDNLGKIDGFSALPIYRDILLGIPAEPDDSAAGAKVNAASNSGDDKMTGTEPCGCGDVHPVKDYVNDVVIDNLGKIDGFSALPIYRDILLGIPAEPPAEEETVSPAKVGSHNGLGQRRERLLPTFRNDGLTSAVEASGNSGNKFEPKRSSKPWVLGNGSGAENGMFSGLRGFGGGGLGGGGLFGGGKDREASSDGSE